MAIQSLQCPNCLGQIELDDKKETGYCTYCGSLIQIKEYIEKIRVEHVVDDSKKLSNAITLANRAFNSGNYDECYKYCCTALECNIDNAYITIRKGLSAAYMSYSRINELDDAIEIAKEIINRTSKDPDSDFYAMFTDIFNYIKVIYVMDCERPKNFIYPDHITLNSTFQIVITLSRLCCVCSMLISNDMIEANPTYEDEKKECLEQGLKLCKQGLSSFKYLEGYETVKEGKSFKQEPIYKNASSPYADAQKQFYHEFKEAFNTLPSTTKALCQYDVEIERLEQAMKNYTIRFEEYLQENPDIAQAYKQNPINFYRRLFKKGKTRRQILSELPSDIASLRDIHDLSKGQLRSVQQAKAAFIKQNIIK